MLVPIQVKDEDGLNAMVEASFSGVAVRPLCERVRRSSASQICVRRLQVCLPASVCVRKKEKISFQLCVWVDKHVKCVTIGESKLDALVRSPCTLRR